MLNLKATSVMWWKINYKTAGICPACLKFTRNFKPYDENDTEVYMKNACPDCQSEALTVGIEKLETFLKSKSMADLEAREKHWLSVKDRYRAEFWKGVKKRIEKLKELKATGEFTDTGVSNQTT